MRLGFGGRNMNRSRIITAVFVCLGLLLASAVRAETPVPVNRTLIVGTKEAPPFAMKNADGTWTGISIELWQAIAKDLQLRYELREFDLQGLLSGVKDGSLDAAVAALTITAKREKVMDFTHPFYTTGLGIAISRRAGGTWFSVVQHIFSGRFLGMVATLLFLLFVVGVLVWLSEREKNPQQVGGGLKGIWSGFWWAAVTMTTVGYGDKAPVTVGGRILALVWMFTALVMLAGFLAAFTSALTVSELELSLLGPEDLVNARVGTLAESSSATYLQENRILHLIYPTLREGLQAVAIGEIDAVVYDMPLLRYVITTELPGALEVLPYILEPQEYSIALPTGSPLREPINQVLLEKTHQRAWKDLLFRYLGN